MGAASLGLPYGLIALALIYPLSRLVTGRARLVAVALAVASFVVGFALVPSPLAAVLPVSAIALKGGTLLAGAYLLLAVIDVAVLDKVLRRRPAALRGIVFVLAATLLVFDGMDAGAQVALASFLKLNATPWIWATLTLLVVGVIGFFAYRGLDSLGIDRYLTLWNFLLFAAAVRAVAQPPVLPTLQALLERVAHDSVHMLVMLAQLPDHTFLTQPVWTIIGLSFTTTSGVLLNLAVYFAVALFVVLTLSRRPLPVVDGEKAADRRRRWARIRRGRRLTYAPVFIGVVLFSLVAYRAAAVGAAPYRPATIEPVPSRGISTATLADGRLHIYSLGDGQSRALAVKKPDGTYSVDLDSCLVCPPTGYAQLGQDLFCQYCGTPIPIATVGKPGGCNPIPVAFKRSGDRLVFDVTAAQARWKQANRGK